MWQVIRLNLTKKHNKATTEKKRSRRIRKKLSTIPHIKKKRQEKIFTSMRRLSRIYMKDLQEEK